MLRRTGERLHAFPPTADKRQTQHDSKLILRWPCLPLAWTKGPDTVSTILYACFLVSSYVGQKKITQEYLITVPLFKVNCALPRIAQKKSSYFRSFFKVITFLLFTQLTLQASRSFLVYLQPSLPKLSYLVRYYSSLDYS